MPPDAGIVGKGDLTLEKILEEKKVFDLSLRFERLGAGDGDRGWSVPGKLERGVRSLSRFDSLMLLLQPLRNLSLYLLYLLQPTCSTCLSNHS